MSLKGNPGYDHSRDFDIYCVVLTDTWVNPNHVSILWPLLLTWFNFNPSMDK